MKQWEFPSSAERSLHPPLRWLGWRVKADRDCSASGVGSRNHSPLECCLVRYSLNSHTNRWIALPLFCFVFNVCQTLALHWIVLILRLQTSRSGKMDESDMLPCIEEHKSHFWCAFLFSFPNLSCHSDYPAFHTSLFCSHCKSKRPVPQIGAATRESECDLFLVISIENKIKKKVC